MSSSQPPHPTATGKALDATRASDRAARAVWRRLCLGASASWLDEIWALRTVGDGFEASLADWPEVRECHMIRGGGDFLLKMVARDKEHRDALTMRITSTTHVSRVTTFETIRTSKSLTGVPVEDDAPA